MRNVSILLFRARCAITNNIITCDRVLLYEMDINEQPMLSRGIDFGGDVALTSNVAGDIRIAPSGLETESLASESTLLGWWEGWMEMYSEHKGSGSGTWGWYITESCRGTWAAYRR